MARRERESLHHKYPDYRVDVEPHPGRVRVTAGGEVVADTRRALRLQETRHAPAVYIPRDDVRMEFLLRTEHETFCPFKGVASYWTLRVDEPSLENVVWSYEDPFEQASGLKDYVSFYTNRVEIEES